MGSRKDKTMDTMDKIDRIITHEEQAIEIAKKSEDWNFDNYFEDYFDYEIDYSFDIERVKS